jgi:hypothetical protein
VFSSYGRGCSSKLVQAVDRFLIPTHLRNHNPTGTAKGCRAAARDILVVAMAGHNNAILTPTAIFDGTGHQILCSNSYNYIIKILLSHNYLRNKYFAVSSSFYRELYTEGNVTCLHV